MSPFSKGKMRRKVETRFGVIDVVLILLTVIGCQGKAMKQDGLFCDPKNHTYYNYQIHNCIECDRCLDGMEPDLNGADLGMGLHGATKCSGCRDCRHGTFNPDGGKYWYCISCTTCTDLGMHEVQACSPTQDTECNHTIQSDTIARPTSKAHFDEYVAESQDFEVAEIYLYQQRIIDILAAIVVTGVVMIFLFILHKQKIRMGTLRHFLGKPEHPGDQEKIPLNKTETQITEEQKWQHLDNERPCDAGVRYLSILLKDNESYLRFARHMGITDIQVKSIEDEDKLRDFDTGYLSLKYTEEVLKHKEGLSYHVIYDALEHLHLNEVLVKLQKERRRQFDKQETNWHFNRKDTWRYLLRFNESLYVTSVPELNQREELSDIFYDVLTQIKKISPLKDTLALEDSI